MWFEFVVGLIILKSEYILRSLRLYPGAPLLPVHRAPHAIVQGPPRPRAQRDHRQVSDFFIWVLFSSHNYSLALLKTDEKGFQAVAAAVVI